MRFIEKLFFRYRYGLASRVRIWFLRGLGMRIGPNCRVEAVRVRRPRQIAMGPHNALSQGCWLWPIDEDGEDTRISIGEGNYFNRDVMIDACGRIEIGNQNMFGPGVYLTDSNHVMQPGHGPARGGMSRGRIMIGNGCWLGARAVVLKDVVLGDHCIVGAGAVVTKSFPAGSVIGGVPAVALKKSVAAAMPAQQENS